MTKIRSNSRGSLTAEASIVMLCLIFYILFLMSYLGGLYTESLVEESLLEASQVVRAKVPLLTSNQGLAVLEEGLFDSLVGEAFEQAFEKRLNQRQLFRYGIKDLVMDSTASSYKSTVEGKMKLSINLEWQLLFLESQKIKIERTLYCQRLPVFFHVDFTTDRRDKQDISVYLADHPSVYHTNENCRSIKNRNKRQVKLSTLNGLYRECKFCLREKDKDG